MDSKYESAMNCVINETSSPANGTATICFWDNKRSFLDWDETNMASVRTLNVSSESLLITTVGNKENIGIVALAFG